MTQVNSNNLNFMCLLLLGGLASLARGILGTQLDTVGVPPWNIHVFRFIPGGGRVAGFYGVWLVQIPQPLAYLGRGLGGLVFG